MGIGRQRDRIAVLVGLRGGDLELGKDLAMHVAASDPRFALRSEVTDAMLETEREIARAQAVGLTNMAERMKQWFKANF